MALRNARKIELLLCCEDHCEDHCKDHCEDHYEDHCEDHFEDHCEDHCEDHYVDLDLLMTGGQAVGPGHGRHRTPQSVRRPVNYQH